jgi:SAM-dependent methyltransferase
MATASTTNDLDLPLPPAALRFMGESDATFVTVGDELAREVLDNGLALDGSLLDVGSGYGRLALGLLRSPRSRARSLRFHILPRHVAWCQGEISAAHPTFEFRLLDIRNERYNPKGRLDPAGARFPAGDRSFDGCAVFSVFTHLYQPVARQYLREIRRVLRPGGFAVTTWLLFDDARIPAITSDGAAYPMIHVLDEATRYASEEDPLRAIAFRQDLVVDLIAAAGLEVASVERGSWAGEPGRTFQDTIVIRRPAGDQPSLPRRLVDRLRLGRR